MQVSASDTLDGKAMLDSEADEYLKEWVNAEEIRERCIISECLSFRYANHSKLASFLFGRASGFELLQLVLSLCSFRDADAAKHALDVYGRIIGVQQYIQVRFAAWQKLCKVFLPGL